MHNVTHSDVNMFNLHIKQTEISQKRSEETKNCKRCYFVIWSVLLKTKFSFMGTLRGELFPGLNYAISELPAEPCTVFWLNCPVDKTKLMQIWVRNQDEIIAKLINNNFKCIFFASIN